MSAEAVIQLPRVASVEVLLPPSRRTSPADPTAAFMGVMGACDCSCHGDSTLSAGDFAGHGNGDYCGKDTDLSVVLGCCPSMSSGSDGATTTTTVVKLTAAEMLDMTFKQVGARCRG